MDSVVPPPNGASHPPRTLAEVDHDLREVQRQIGDRGEGLTEARLRHNTNITRLIWWRGIDAKASRARTRLLYTQLMATRYDVLRARALGLLSIALHAVTLAVLIGRGCA